MSRPARYRILRKIADGGMAEIFLGTQHGVEGFERPVVLKRILAALVADPQFRNLMIDEAHIAMSLNHSNIVQVLDLGHARGRYFLVLELVDGWDLNHLLQRAGAAKLPLPVELSLYIAAEVGRALGYAHGKARDGQPLGIVHRDVSPHNVLLSEQGEVKLTDFGIAKAMGRREHTGHGVIKGKLAFMSPEQASATAVDARSDLFSLGTMLYVLGTGQRPFEAPTDLEGIMRVRQCQFRPPLQACPNMSPEFARIIERAMRATPAERYQSAEEMLIDIENVQRTAFRPAGQTELKRWLAELQQIDGVPTVSRQHSDVPAPAEDQSFDLLEGADLIFDESSEIVVPPEPPVRATQPTVAAVPPFLPVPPASRSGLVLPNRPRRSSRRALVLALSAGAMVSIVLAVLGLRGSPIRPRPRPAPRPAPHSPLALPPTAASAGLAGATDAAAVAPPPPELPVVDAGRDDATPVAGEEDEESLLARTDPSATSRTVGEEDAVPPAPVRGQRIAIRRDGGAVGRAASVPDTASVRVISRPEGAVVRLKDRVFGRAPLDLRFRTGITYELTFVKQGYQTTNKRFTVTGKKKKQSVTVALKRKSPAKKRSFLRRLFGR